MFIDTHCHLSDERLLSQLDEALQSMASAHVKGALCVSTSLEDFSIVQKLANTYPHLWGSIGVHPNETPQTVGITAQQLIAGAQHDKIIAIGETGLDYYRQNNDSAQSIQWQHDRFQEHIDAARQTGLPLIIHTRDSIDDTLAFIKSNISQSGKLTGVFHCFTENRESAKKALDLGFYISFSGILTFKSALELKEVAKMVPQDACLIETDSPYLAPTPYRGKLNTPAYVAYVAAALADLWQVDIETVAEKTTQSFGRLFNKAILAS